jgi:HEAT repeat protein
MYNHEYSDTQRAWTNIQISALSHGEAGRRREAADNLYLVEKDGSCPHFAALAGALSDPDWTVRVAAARPLPRVIGDQGRVLSEEIDFATMVLIPVCRDPRDEVPVEAVKAIGKLNASNRTPAAAGVAPVVRIAVRSVARQALDVLLEAMNDPSPQVRAQAGSIAWACGGDAEPIKAIVEHDSEIKVQIAAVNALAVGWPDDHQLYPLFLGRLKVATDQEEHANIGWTLSSLAPPSAENLPALLDALLPDDWVLRHSIAVALGKLGLAARPALPRLSRVARIELADADSSLSAVKAIITIDPTSPEAQALIEPLMGLIKNSRAEGQQA